jgi:serine/threonine protein phosphatase PrpC
VPDLRTAAGSHIGHRYRANFDVVHLDVDPLLAVVADGMGDGRGSTLAGRTTVDTIVARLTGAEITPSTIRDAVAEAQVRVGAIAQEIGELTGCTLTAMAGAQGGLWIAQVGDSRAYRLRGGLLELLTADHTMAWMGAINGWFPFDSREAATARYHLTRYIGHPDMPEPDVLNVNPRPGDVFLLCSDGVAEQVPYQQLKAILQARDAHGAVVEILEAADAAGGHDNASAIVVRVEGG